MKTKYPIYSRKGSLLEIKKHLSPKNKTEIKKFSEYLARTNQPSKIEKIIRIIIQWYDVTELNLYEKPTIEERDKFLALLNNSHYKSSCRRDVKVYIKKWLRWRWKDLNLLEDFPKLESNGNAKVEEKDLLTRDEIKKIIEVEQDLKWKTLISILTESGARPEEVLNLRWECIEFDGEITNIAFTTKKKSTIKSRKFPVKASTAFLREWKTANPKYKNSDLVFPGSKGKPLSVGGLNHHLKTLAEKAGIEKNIFPYLFRFSKLTELYGGRLDDRSVSELAGHSVSMAGRYHKISNKTAREKLIKEIYQAKKMSKELRQELIKNQEKMGEKLKEMGELMFAVLDTLPKNKRIKLMLKPETAANFSKWKKK
jgi:integrase/recombinase XerD